MAANWGNKESLEEARRFLNQVTTKGGSRGRQGQGNGLDASRTSNGRSAINNPFNSNAHVGQGGPVQGAWRSFDSTASGSISGLPTLATAPPVHPFFNARSGSNKRNGTGDRKRARPSPYDEDDQMDIDDLPRAPSSDLTGSRWGAVNNTNATRTPATVPLQLPAVTTNQNSHITKPQLGHAVLPNNGSGTRSPSPKLGMGASRWALSPITAVESNIANDPPVPATGLVIDNDWQTTYVMEENERIYKIAADNAAAAGDITAEQQLRKVEKLFRAIVEARLNQDEGRERSTRTDVSSAVKFSAPALNKFKNAKAAQPAFSVERARGTSTASREKQPPAQHKFDRWGIRVELRTIQSEENTRLLQEKQLPQPAQPLRPAPAPAPAPVGKEASSQSSLQGLGGKACFDDPEALRLWNDFMKRGN